MDKEYLKKIGISGSLIALISTALTISLFVFKVDSRYAKTETVTAIVEKHNQKVESLASEVDRLVGVTQVLLQLSSRLEQSTQTVALPRLQMRQSIAPPPPMPAAVDDQDLAMAPVFGSLPAPEYPQTQGPEAPEAEEERGVLPMSPAAPPPPDPDELAEALVLEQPPVPAMSSEDVREADADQVREILEQSQSALESTRRNLDKIREF